MEVDEVQSFEVPSNASLDLFLEVVLADAEARHVLSSLGRDHGVDLGDKAQAYPLWIVIVFHRRVNLREGNFDVEVDGGITLDVNSFDLVLLRSRSAAPIRDHLEPASDFIRISKSLLDGGLESGTVDVAGRVKQPAYSRDILSLYRPAIKTVLLLLHPPIEVFV